MNKLYKNKDWLYQEYIIKKISKREIAQRCKCDHGTITRYLHKFNIPIRTLSEAIKLWYENNPHPHKSKRGKDSPHWKGGRHVVGGYVKIYFPTHPYAYNRKYMLEHRLVMEKHLGRYLRLSEIVHHIDGNKENNKIQNLYLTSREKHKHTYVDGYKEGFAKGFLISYLASRYKDSLK